MTVVRKISYIRSCEIRGVRLNTKKANFLPQFDMMRVHGAPGLSPLCQDIFTWPRRAQQRVTRADCWLKDKTESRVKRKSIKSSVSREETLQLREKTSLFLLRRKANEKNANIKSIK